MCIIVDTNNISRVFNPKNAEHLNYIPVFEWIVRGKGKLVIGGSTFEKEITRNKWFLPFLSQLSRVNKVIRIDNQLVDKLENELKAAIPKHLDFDDPHILGLLKASKCKLICSHDKRAYSYFLSNEIFKGLKKPKIYSSNKNSRLLNEKNIAKCCLPCSKLDKGQILSVDKLLQNIK